MKVSELIIEEKQRQHEKDAVGFAALGSRSRAVAVWVGNATFWLHKATTVAVQFTMKPFDRVFDVVCRKPWQAVSGLFKRKRAADAPPRPERPFWRKIKGAFGKAGDFIGRHGALGLYRVTEWMLNPRTRSGQPLFKNAFMNKAMKIGGGIAALVGMMAAFAGIEIVTKIAHVKATEIVRHSTSPLIVALGQEAAVHAFILGASYAAMFLLVPAIAATRQVLKEFDFFKGMSHQYNERLRTWRAERQQTMETGWTPSGATMKMFRSLLEQTSPEYYRAKLAYYRELAAPKAEAAPVIVPPDAASTLGDKTVGPAFNDNAPPGLSADKAAPPAPKNGTDGPKPS